ncbi:histidine phosphatase family protein [Brevundimonas sp.]|uniref:histidine phosphatase family protein n=1 Tax=Brevundimonas sp. TaxID=1871086 RepID=UPI00184DBF9A|nr:histidine phosphatase family protein [Brevundimonas sp.]MBA4808512.1 histidine phosphatase family protein [Brevundimonas sp.]
MTVVHLVRHGSHDLVSRQLCGRAAGVELGEVGLRQSRAVARVLSRPDRVLTSPLERTRQTAAIIAAAHDRPLEEEQALNEIDFGDWTGRAFTELDPLPEWRRWNAQRDQARAPNGESMLEVQTRLSRWLETLWATEAGTVAAVSHADVIKSVVALVLGLSIGRHDRFEVSPGSITTVEASADGLKLLRLNEVPHG